MVWAPSINAHLVQWTAGGRRRRAQRRDHDQAHEVAWDVARQLAAPGARPVPPPTATRGTPAGSQAGGAASGRPRTVAELVAAYLEAAEAERGWTRTYTTRCWSTWRTWIEPHLGTVPVTQWVPADTAALMAATVGLAYSTRAGLLQLLGRAARHGRLLGLLATDPCAGVELTRPKRHRPTAVVTADNAAGGVRFVEVTERPPTEAVERLAAAADLPGERYRPCDVGLAVRVAAYGGARLGELLALEGVDLRHDERTIAIERRVDAEATAADGDVPTPDGRRLRYWTTPYGHVALPKYDKTRLTLLPDHLGADLAERRGNGLLWPSPRTGGYWSPSTFSSSRIGKAMAIADWPRQPDGRNIWTCHSLRHHAATWMLEDLRAHVTQVAEALGHADPQTTWRMYVHPLPGAVSVLGDSSVGWQPPPVDLDPPAPVVERPPAARSVQGRQAATPRGP